MVSDERDLAHLAIHGDREAFGELMRRHQAEVFNVAYRMLGNRQDAEDATQDAFIRAYRSFPSFDPDRPPGPWLKKIAVNVCLNRLEHRQDLPLIDEAPPYDLDPHPGPEVQTERRDLSDRIRSELLHLSPRYRAAIELRHFQGLNYAEMAEVLSCPMNNLKSDLFRARRLLADRLKDLNPK
jgi:RNA polymerase sigma-70 factor (ECF subfamily)